MISSLKVRYIKAINFTKYEISVLDKKYFFINVNFVTLNKIDLYFRKIYYSK